MCLHDDRLDILADIHEDHDRPNWVYCMFPHDITRIRERFPFVVELNTRLIENWNAGKIEMLVAHHASDGHGVILQYGSDVLGWFSLPWSAELFAQASARLARQAQRGSGAMRMITNTEQIDGVTLEVPRQRLIEQDETITELEQETNE